MTRLSQKAFRIGGPDMNRTELHELIRTRRSIRRYQLKPVPLHVMSSILEDGRMAPSGGNRQPWKFIAVTEDKLVRGMHSCVRWLRSCGPSPGEEPTAYIVLIGDQVNCSFAAATMLISAHIEGLGACVIGSIDKEGVCTLLGIPTAESIALVISLGYPLEEAISTDMREGSCEVAKDIDGVVRVPKRPFGDMIRHNRYDQSMEKY